MELQINKITAVILEGNIFNEPVTAAAVLFYCIEKGEYICPWYSSISSCLVISMSASAYIKDYRGIAEYSVF
ncbi:MAG: hypothetical protein ACOC7X_06090 [Spirochaetota bacterium]